MSTNRNDGIFACSFAVAMLLLVLIAIFVPRQVITQYPILQDYIAVSRSLIPGIERLAAVSSFPEVTRLVVSAMWTLVPIFVAVYLLKVQATKRFVEHVRQRRFFHTFGIVVIAISVVLLAVLYDITPQDLEGGLLNETVLRTISTSRMGLGLITGFFSAGIAMLVYMVLIWLLNLPRIYFSKQGGTTL
jgi:uncharacterized membrane protein YfcA